ncbi:protein FAR1-RELATED SEQUENCE 5-like [Aegilops tauschii subsp. strangulata]|uniref:protein FAR1-RELATED SEQUENCE 5-like n=1 Tax=Aegilops tauschii subsp. strangulata TaxID=200361 RepID=UPI000989C371|nr:protein FAR1-RELATED SEQUENCE 5-like [Aegilops tauschii subsp. strangulata]
MMSTLSHMSGGLQYMGHTSRDWVNKKQKFAREESPDDVKKLLGFFENMQKINPEFFYDYDVDADNRVRNVFWANASCKGSYEDFGDCVTFDTTYKTNKFHMPLGVFVGVNHHLQSTIFAVALVRDETIPSFEWVFKTFLRCMNNKPPICMLTDQCSSMKAALKTILPHTLHTLCRWHIMKKYKDHLALLYKAHEKLKDDLNAVLNHPLMLSEFDRAWKDLIQRYNLQEDEVMNSLWDDKHEWISAYYKEIFCARMTSTQRSESMNHILKINFVKEKHDLHLFAQ